MKFCKIFFSAFISLALVACNRDEVLEKEAPSDGRRPITNLSTAEQDMVYEYTPAPGQFINDQPIGGFTGEETTPEAACAYALERLSQKRTLSLGAFGGYAIVGFDHSIINLGQGYDFCIGGNAFIASHGSSNEPGIVWVMQDTNGNRKPDDEWYQLAGSEYGAESTIKNYSVTYFRPQGPNMPVEWIDSEGKTGTIDYLRTHRQDYYYPAWIKADSYTLVGCRLEPRVEQDSATGEWANLAYPWGYADNVGSDSIDNDNPSPEQNKVGFKISNAVDSDGTHVELAFIDFIKVQTAVQSKAGHIGENSCEVIFFQDLNPAFSQR